MPDDYDKLKKEFSEKFKKVETEIKAAERTGAKFPVYIVDELRLGGDCAIKAEEEASKGDKEGAIKGMELAICHLDEAFSDVLKFHLLECAKKARDARTEFEGDEDLAFKYIPNYVKHSKILYEIRKLIESKNWPKKVSIEEQTIYYTEKINDLQEFVSDFEALKPALTAARKKEKEAVAREQNANRLIKLQIKVSTWGVIVAAVLSAILVNISKKPLDKVWEWFFGS